MRDMIRATSAKKVFIGIGVISFIICLMILIEYHTRFQFEQYSFYYKDESVQKKYCLTLNMKTFQKGSTYEPAKKTIGITLLDTKMSDTLFHESIKFDQMMGIEYEVNWKKDDSLKVEIDIIEIRAPDLIKEDFFYSDERGSYTKIRLTDGVTLRKKLEYTVY